jgi:hypothetical protein
LELRRGGRNICRIGFRLRIGFLLIGAPLLLVFLVLLMAGAPRAAAPKPITGKLSKAGYTVIALAPSGRATSVRVRGRNFKLALPASAVTLHLRAPNGRYAGPIVVGTKGKLAVVGIRAGAKLGAISIRNGYARVTKRLPKSFVDARRVARAKKGVPIGAGVFGRVTSRPSAATGLPGQDRDLDGVPSTLDIDDDGDRVLDNFDRQAGGGATARAFGLSQTANENSIFVFHSLSLHVSDTVNVHAGAVTDAQIDSLLSWRGSLSVSKRPGESRELDCGGLIYCSPGGTGEVGRAPCCHGAEFPECCDPDGDGFGSMESGNQHIFFLSHGATSAQIRTGDVLIERVTTGGVETAFTGTLQGVIATIPALVSYTDGQGTSATISYPVAPHEAYPVKAGPGGDVVVTVTLWRPQRRPIPPETAEWIDIGGLMYQVRASNPILGPGHAPPLPKACPQDAYSTTDPNVGPRPASLPDFWDGALSDLAPDRPASAANTLTFSVNLSRCLAFNGVSWAPGETVGFSFKGFNASPAGIRELVEQTVGFKLQ